MAVIWLFYGCLDGRLNIMKDLSQLALTGKIINCIAEIERFSGGWKRTKAFKPSFIRNLAQTTIITSSGASTRIEGAILTDDQVRDLVEKGCKITSISSRSEREVAGYLKALNFIYEESHNLKISEYRIRELHSLLTSELTEDQLPEKQRGIYKDIRNDVIEKNLESGQEKVWFETTPPGPQTESGMEQLIKDYDNYEISKEIHPLVLIGGFIVHFLAIHPFRDGNGRLSRLLTILLLLRHGYDWVQFASHEKVIEDNKQAYYVALRSTQKSLSDERVQYRPWIEFFLRITLQQTKILEDKIYTTEIRPGLNPNETKVLEIINKYPNCSISFIEERIDMTRAGLKSLLNRLIERGEVQKTGKQKGVKYYV